MNDTTISEEITSEYSDIITTESGDSLMTEDILSEYQINLVSGIGDVAGTEISGDPIGGYLSYESKRDVFDRICDE